MTTERRSYKAGRKEMMGNSYVRGRRNIACVDLIGHLREMGIRASVGYTHGSRENRLYVHCKSPDDVDKVPAEWEGWDLVVDAKPAENSN